MRATAIETALRKWARERWQATSIEAIAARLDVSRATLFRIFTGESDLSLNRAMKAGIDLAWLQAQLAPQSPPATLGVVSTRYSRTHPAPTPKRARA